MRRTLSTATINASASVLGVGAVLVAIAALRNSPHEGRRDQYTAGDQGQAPGCSETYVLACPPQVEIGVGGRRILSITQVGPDRKYGSPVMYGHTVVRLTCRQRVHLRSALTMRNI